MRLRLFAPAALVVALAIAAASATGTSQASPAKAQADALTVWLMGDAQTNWPEAVANATQTFKAQHPGVDVNVQYQSWGDYKTKFEATLSAGSGPDVIEFGNTDVPKYSAAGALAPLNKGRLPELRHVAVGPDEGGQLQRQALRSARTTPAPAASSTAPTSTRRPGSRRRRRRSPSSTPPTRS